MNNFGFLVNKDNFCFIFIGFVINILGYIFMIGGGFDDLNVFNE